VATKKDNCAFEENRLSGSPATGASDGSSHTLVDRQSNLYSALKTAQQQSTVWFVQVLFLAVKFPQTASSHVYVKRDAVADQVGYYEPLFGQRDFPGSEP
jgi:hypothetical protein